MLVALVSEAVILWYYVKLIVWMIWEWETNWVFGIFRDVVLRDSNFFDLSWTWTSGWRQVVCWSGPLVFTGLGKCPKAALGGKHFAFIQLLVPVRAWNCDLDFCICFLMLNTCVRFDDSFMRNDPKLNNWFCSHLENQCSQSIM